MGLRNRIEIGGTNLRKFGIRRPTAYYLAHKVNSAQIRSYHHLTASEKSKIRMLSLRGWGSVGIAAELARNNEKVRRYQQRLKLPTKRGKLDTQKVIRLARKGWSAERIAAFLGSKLTVISQILARHTAQEVRAKHRAAAEKDKARTKLARLEREQRFFEAVLQLALQYGVAPGRARRLAHGFRSRRLAEQEEILRSEPEKRQTVDARYRDSLNLFLNKCCGGKLPEPQDDTALLQLFAKNIPDWVPDFERSEILLGLISAIKEARFASASPWIH